MILFFDTETTGLPKNWQAPIDDLDNWPRLVQLAWILTDGEGQEAEVKSRIIRPEGFIIPEESSRIHRITNERAQAEGAPLGEVLLEFDQALQAAKILVAHNMNFDEKIMGAEFLRKKFANKLFDKVKICTMQETIDYCAIPGNNGYKWPKLAELYRKLFNRDFEDAHDASADARACARCFFEMLNRKII